MFHCLQKYFIDLHSLFITSCLCNRLHLEEASLYNWIDELSIGVYYFPTIDHKLIATCGTVSIWSSKWLEVFRIIKYKCWLDEFCTGCFFVDIIEEICSSDSIYFFYSDFFCDFLQLFERITEHINSGVFFEEIWESFFIEFCSEIHIDEFPVFVHHLDY